MLKVIKMAGTSQELYKCVAPLVMNPDILKYNHNYPFKTSESFIWFVAFYEKKVLGFFPVEVRKKQLSSTIIMWRMMMSRCLRVCWKL